MTDAVKQMFEALEWHDAVLLTLNIDRRMLGQGDEVALMVEWPDGRTQAVRFTDCYALDARLNFGVLAPESIRGAKCLAVTPELAEIRRRWGTLGVELQSLRCFEISTNSTGGELRVYAKHFELSDA